MKGTKKVYKGTVRAVKGKDKNKPIDGKDDYNARNLADRTQIDFLDRITSMVETTSAADDHGDAELENAILAGIAAASNHEGGPAGGAAAQPKKGSSVLMPMDLVGSTHGSWDV